MNITEIEKAQLVDALITSSTGEQAVTKAAVDLARKLCTAHDTLVERVQKLVSQRDVSEAAHEFAAQQFERMSRDYQGKSWLQTDLEDRAKALRSRALILRQIREQHAKKPEIANAIAKLCELTRVRDDLEVGSVERARRDHEITGLVLALRETSGLGYSGLTRGEIEAYVQVARENP